MTQEDSGWQSRTVAILLEARKRNGRLGSKKSRSGCVTCKARKLKCDEVKPECNNCRSTGRKCLGYPGLSPESEETSLILAKREPSQLPDLLNGDRRTLDFFLSWVAPHLAGSFDQEFWCGHLLQLVRAEPFVLDSVLAISTLYEHPQFMPSFYWHRHEPSQLNRSDQELLLDEHHASALKHYNKAIAKFQERLKDGKATPFLALLSCSLFLCVELIRDNIFVAIALYAKGVGLLEQFKSNIPEEDSNSPLTLMKLMLSRVGALVPTFNKLINDGLRPSNFMPQEYFTSLSDARTALFSLISDSYGFEKAAGARKEAVIMGTLVEENDPHQSPALSYNDGVLEMVYGIKYRGVAKLEPSLSEVGSPMGFPTMLPDFGGETYPEFQTFLRLNDLDYRDHLSESLEQAGLSSKCPSASSLDSLQEWESSLKTGLSQWLNSFQAQMKEHAQSEAVNYLMMYYHSTLIWLSTRLHPNERAFDEYTSNFESLLRHAEIYVNAKEVDHPTFTFEIGATPPLGLVASKCRVPLLRRQAIDLLQRAPRKECMHGSHSSSEFLCRLVVIEEEGLGHLLPDVSGRCATQEIDNAILPAENKRIHDVELLRDISTVTHYIRITRYSAANSHFQRNFDIVPF